MSGERSIGKRAQRLATGVGCGFVVAFLATAAAAAPTVPTATGCGLLMTCPTAPPTVTSIEVGQATDGPSGISVPVEGMVDTGGFPTSYYYTYTPVNPAGPQQQTPTQSLSTSSSSSSSSSSSEESATATLTGISATTEYAVTLVATNSAGSASQSTQFQIEKPRTQPPKLTIEKFRVSSQSVTIGTQLTFTGTLAGDVSAWEEYLGTTSLTVHVKATPGLRVPPNQQGQDDTFSLTDHETIRGIIPLSNTVFRMTAATSQSTPIEVYVSPSIGVTTTRPDEAKPTLKTVVDAAIAPEKTSFRTAPVFIYESASQHGVATLVGATRLHPDGSDFGETDVTGSVSFNQPNRGYVEACTARPLVANMGKPFSDPACGHQHLRF